HTKLDVARWRTSQTSEGFLPEEREWIDSLLSPRTLVDVVRAVHPGVEGPYAWWSWLGEAYAKDVGWRIDYHLATPRLARTAVSGRPGVEGPYGWWSWWGEAYAKDVGWRIDYPLAIPRLARTAVSATVDRHHRGVRLSDHAPVVVDYSIESLERSTPVPGR